MRCIKKKKPIIEAKPLLKILAPPDIPMVFRQLSDIIPDKVRLMTKKKKQNE